MSNKHIKLYTEEQVREAWNTAFMQGMSIDSEIYEPVFFEDFLKKLTPIQLPNDEEIREERLLQFPDSEYANRANDRLAFYCGAKFVINKIQGGKL